MMAFVLSVFKFPMFFTYIVYDLCIYYYLKLYKNFYGWGIHLYTGRFGNGKTLSMCAVAYQLCTKYPQLSIVTNLQLRNFPEYTQILPLRTAKDILMAPADCLVLIDEIGTVFNNRDFSSGKSVPKFLFQHFCQCRKRNMMILGTVQKYSLLDKQIRDISADVNVCRPMFSHPFTRKVNIYTYDVEDYEMYLTNRMYTPRVMQTRVLIQQNIYRNIYSTDELIDTVLNDSNYLSDAEILQNRGVVDTSFTPFEHKPKFKNRGRL